MVKPNVVGPDIDVNLNGERQSVSAGLQGPKLDFKESGKIAINTSGVKTSSGLQFPEGTVTFPKIKAPKFGIALPHVEGRTEVGGDDSGTAVGGDIKIQSPSVSFHGGAQNIEVPSPELSHSEGKVKGKMPKLFGKSKGKGGSEVDLNVGTDFDTSGGGKSGKLEVGGGSGLHLSGKGKSASLDLLKKSKHQPSSSDETGLALSSTSTHQESEGGDISLDLGGAKVKGKKGKLKFGTFGGFGAKSKGSYEVSLGEDSEARVEGSGGVSLPSKKSRLSSSSSSDSGSRGFRFPKLELSVSPKK